ncbi:MAG: Na(+)-translocating NADH-quinone reductase subunit C [Pseudomonadales bacterium]|jgi:Na+-transporting NADH:ubiquinone oxidoreductase subunit C|uniref:Na(+)-translocating NADH-quinone reductase subunit C n=1 Tax=unclassified Ketobacter TaxID=2639109 RepID=UPI000C8BB431|nr:MULTISPECIES: Na(+)-translocating NADH-quinone reductase subunit C [unclassified Ketobacter]MAQ26274.1 Na(+)-translocating NADH-quinone reductase subunit C [Pseudomonadales bacterium]MEC8809964.1 Na(+)-translocating NADH-quinone reductase subunit C [Pseudomonadota bacterium]TNC90390.1 MAG: Na(+)-translocating NADH-quinone reductase subunit C [Alcanivorax sp.]HAG96542.1 Na(+)-translocating NADH-quinone reductase subunit C [Gammaproteobacteria bacterium]MCK5789578.1 Na(+)-translocating NADH-q|tara:strand:+ start:627 stop:1442 length:816 start_codon:yes stop_codon:yes gene_type:complete
MSSNDSTGKTLLVASLLCIVCSIVVSTAAVALKGEQVKNKLLDKNRNILAAAGMLEEGKSVQEIFEQRLEVKLVNLDTGEYLTEETATEDWQKAALKNPVAYDQRKAAKTKGQNEILEGSEDIASIKRQAQYATVYLAKDEAGNVETIILPVHGYGLWSTLYGFLALQTDAKTVVGLGFYEHGETPGLGGEVDNPKWKSMWPGKEVFDEEGDVAIRLVKGSVDPKAPNAEHKVDGLAGATLTSNGVTNLLQFWLGKNGFGPYLEKVKEQGV